MAYLHMNNININKRIGHFLVLHISIAMSNFLSVQYHKAMVTKADK